jgi:hypothetical protein
MPDLSDLRDAHRLRPVLQPVNDSVARHLELMQRVLQEMMNRLQEMLDRR